MDRIKIKRNGALLSALVMLICLSTAFFAASKRINDLEVQACYDSLRQSTQLLAQEIRQDVQADEKLLQTVAHVIAGYEEIDCGNTERLLAACEKGNLFSRVEILFPDDQVLSGGRRRGDSGRLSFARLSAKGAHISGREADFDGSPVLRHYVPIVKDGETRAMLYGVIELSRLPELYSDFSRSDESILYMFERGSGDYLLDTLHESLGNIRLLGERQIKRGYDLERTAAGIAAGEPGRVAFRSETAGEFLYCEYGPVGVNDWMIMYSLPESRALAGARNIRMLLTQLALLEAAILVAYFVWLISRNKRETVEKETQLKRIQYMLDVGEILFKALGDPGMMRKALEKVADMLTAECAFFVSRRGGLETETFLFSAGDRPEKRLERAQALKGQLPHLTKLFQREGRILTYDPASFLRESPEEEALLDKYGVGSMMLIPVKDPEGGQIGLLGAVNMKRRWRTTELLDSVMLSFSMALNNLESFRKIREMGMIDRLTGLRNQNSFQKAMEAYEKSGDRSLACIYIDADGLHEINNHYGHISGDRLLKTVADALKAQFGTEDVYRIGGDEFIAFCSGLTEEQAAGKISDMEQAVALGNYHISVGVEWRSRVPLVCEMVRRAEENMYEAKRRYYQNKDDRHQVREMNRQLEETLTEKRDLDVFRSVLAFKYLGVYIVDLRLDTLRPIYIPPYFERAVQAVGGKFSAAIRLYVKDNVLPAYWEALERLLDFERVEALLRRGEEPELRYQRNDGVWLLLRIHSSPDASRKEKECIWSFEHMDGETNQKAAANPL